jgi:hypothetical protein
MSIKDNMDLSHVYIVTMIYTVSILDIPKSHHPMDPVLVGTVLYIPVQAKIEKSCAQQKLTIINNIQIFCMIEQNKLFSVKS